MARALRAEWVRQEYRHMLVTFNTDCFSTAIMGTQICLNVMLYEHCLVCYHSYHMELAYMKHLYVEGDPIPLLEHQVLHLKDGERCSNCLVNYLVKCACFNPNIHTIEIKKFRVFGLSRPHHIPLHKSLCMAAGSAWIATIPIFLIEAPHILFQCTAVNITFFTMSIPHPTVILNSAPVQFTKIFKYISVLGINSNYFTKKY